MVPVGRSMKEANAAFVVGERYRLVEHQERSTASHRHYFSCIADAWANLREDAQANYPTPEHLRKWALVKAGYYDERSIVCSSKAEARRIAAFVRPMDEYAVVVVSEAVVRVFTAKSQSMKAMGKREFYESKDKTLSVIANLIGVAPEELGKAA